MDFSKYRETKQKLEHYDARLETLKELQNETYEKRQEVCDNCSHDFVLVYNSELKVVGHSEKGVLKQAGCLVCGQYFRLDEIYMDEITDQQINEDAVLDVSNETSLFSQRLSRDNKSVLLLKAEEVFNEYCKLNAMCFSREQVLKDIQRKVLELDSYYVNLELGRKMTYEEELTKKKK